MGSLCGRQGRHALWCRLGQGQGEGTGTGAGLGARWRGVLLAACMQVTGAVHGQAVSGAVHGQAWSRYPYALVQLRQIPWVVCVRVCWGGDHWHRRALMRAVKRQRRQCGRGRADQRNATADQAAVRSDAGTYLEQPPTLAPDLDRPRKCADLRAHSAWAGAGAGTGAWAGRPSRSRKRCRQLCPPCSFMPPPLSQMPTAPTNHTRAVQCTCMCTASTHVPAPPSRPPRARSPHAQGRPSCRQGGAGRGEGGSDAGRHVAQRA